MWVIRVTHNHTFSPNFPKFLWITLDPFISWTALIQGPIMVFKLILIGWRSRPIRDKDTFGPIPGCIYFVHIRNKAKSSILIGEFKHHSNLSDETACRKCFEQISCFCITLKCMVSHILWVIMIDESYQNISDSILSLGWLIIICVGLIRWVCFNSSISVCTWV